MNWTLDNLRVATDRWINPILLKELRATFRGWKFLAVHAGFLGLMAIALIVVILSLSEVSRIQPATIGLSIHQVFLVGMGLAILFVLPAFASTAIVTEREQNTFELLQTTSLDAAGVIRGKFLASMVYSMIFLISSLPVGALAFLYGGISVTNLAVAYGGLVVFSALTNVFSIFISAHSRTSRTALGSTAVFGMFVGVATVLFLSALETKRLTSLAVSLLGLQGMVSRRYFTFSAPDPADAFLYLFALPGFVILAIFVFAAISATNRIKPRSGNRSTNLKVFFLGFMFTGTALWFVLMFRERLPTVWQRWQTAITFFGAFGVVATLSSFFAAEDPAHHLPARLRRPPRLTLLSLFWPGSTNGFVFTLTTTALLLPPSVLLLNRFMRVKDDAFLFPMAGLAVTILSFLFLSASTGVLLSTLIRNERARMAAQAGIVVFLFFFPLIAYAALHQFEPLPSLSPVDPGLFSPVIAFGSLTTGFYEKSGIEANPGQMESRAIFPFDVSVGSREIPAF
ncbi:MAG: ABC transporter permease, partial [Planctomycetota bacterium]